LTKPSSDRQQADRFKEAAREAECDEDRARWEAKLRQIAKQKPKGA
jgi:hypothetical protein